MDLTNLRKKYEFITHFKIYLIYALNSIHNVDKSNYIWIYMIENYVYTLMPLCFKKFFISRAFPRYHTKILQRIGCFYMIVLNCQTDSFWFLYVNENTIVCLRRLYRNSKSYKKRQKSAPSKNVWICVMRMEINVSNFATKIHTMMYHQNYTGN